MPQWMAYERIRDVAHAAAPGSSADAAARSNAEFSVVFVAAGDALTPVDDLRPAQWLIDSIYSFGDDVSALVPSVFEDYGRVFHPAYRGNGGERSVVSWAEIARINHKVAHPQMQFHRLIGYPTRYSPRYLAELPGVVDEAPGEGNLPPDVAAALAHILAGHTTTPKDCWFAVWHGFSGLSQVFEGRPTFELPGRNYYLAHGAVGSAAQSVGSCAWVQSCNLWWPDDHAWCVATEIDLDSTYVGASRACIQDLLADPQLESARVPLTAGIDAFSDSLNPAVGPEL
jgi:hypothetical protein